MSDQSLPENQSSGKKKFQFPHVFVILFSLIVIMSILTYIIPAGEYDRGVTEDGTEVVIDGTYETVASNPTGFFGIFQAVHRGMEEGAGIIFFIFIVGGAFGILNATKAIETGLSAVSNKMQGKELFIIPVVMTLFSLGGATFGMAEEAIPMILILVPLAIKLGFDSMVGTAMVLVGIYAGFTAAFLNPFTVGVAQGIADVPIFSGIGFRLVAWVVFVVISVAYVMIYARKVKKNPELSSMHEFDLKRSVEDLEQTHDADLGMRKALILAVLGITVVGLAFGVTVFDWYITEIAGLFLLMGIIIGFIGNLRINEIAKAFVKGSEELVVGALVVGFAYGILVVLEDSFTIDTILHSISSVVSQLPTSLTAIGMYVTQNLLNFIVPSGSGQAALTMPIMTPLADLTGVSRQTAVFAFQLGDGISNILTPTGSVLMASLALAKIPWVKWVKWVIPLILLQFVVGATLVTIAHLFVWTA